MPGIIQSVNTMLKGLGQFLPCSTSIGNGHYLVAMGS